MGQRVKLERLYSYLDGLEYPCSVRDVTEAGADVTLVLADGTVDLDAVIADSTSGEFASTDELASEVLSLLPRRAVGEPYQSEGEG